MRFNTHVLAKSTETDIFMTKIPVNTIGVPEGGRCMRTV